MNIIDFIIFSCIILWEKKPIFCIASIFYFRFAAEMASADDYYGKLQLIDPNDDSDDGETASNVIPGIKHAVTTEGV